jgi:hypothetical protein
MNSASSETLPARQSVSPSLPDSWVERLFQKFEDFYGAKWAAQFGDFPRDRVKATWAEELAGFADKGDAIAQALSAQKSNPFPPTLPEFLNLCRESAKRIGGYSAPALAHKPTAEEREHQSEMAKRLGDSFGAGKLKDGIDTHWATHPRSAAQLRMIFDAAKNDQRFQPCIEQMIADGICSADGHLLKSYRDQQWWPVARRAA